MTFFLINHILLYCGIHDLSSDQPDPTLLWPSFLQQLILFTIMYNLHYYFTLNTYIDIESVLDQHR